jgi:hypothetical protein
VTAGDGDELYVPAIQTQPGSGRITLSPLWGEDTERYKDLDIGDIEDSSTHKATFDDLKPGLYFAGADSWNDWAGIPTYPATQRAERYSPYLVAGAFGLQAAGIAVTGPRSGSLELAYELASTQGAPAVLQPTEVVAVEVPPTEDGISRLAVAPAVMGFNYCGTGPRTWSLGGHYGYAVTAKDNAEHSYQDLGGNRWMTPTSAGFRVPITAHFIGTSDPAQTWQPTHFSAAANDGWTALGLVDGQDWPAFVVEAYPEKSFYCAHPGLDSGVVSDASPAQFLATWQSCEIVQFVGMGESGELWFPTGNTGTEITVVTDQDFNLLEQPVTLTKLVVLAAPYSMATGGVGPAMQGPGKADAVVGYEVDPWEGPHDYGPQWQMRRMLMYMGAEGTDQSPVAPMDLEAALAQVIDDVPHEVDDAPIPQCLGNTTVHTAF